MIQQILIWYFTLQLFALAGLPLAFVAFKRLSSRGYAYAKALGILLSGIIFWWGGITHLWPNSTAAAFTSAGLVFVAGLWMAREQWADIKTWLLEKWLYILTVEALFLVALVAWSLVRAGMPNLQTAGGEKWMEIAFLNASLRAPSMPPHDPWLSGYAISYYHFGYILLAMVTRVSGLASTVAFNLANAGWFALAAIGAYGLVYDMLPRRDVLRPLLAPLMLLVVGNGEGLLELLHARGKLPDAFWDWMNIGGLETARTVDFAKVPQDFFWWWQASRTLQDCAPWGLPWKDCTQPIEMIDEFPAFSFILGDMHPHLLALPFGLLTIALALQIFRMTRSQSEVSTYWRERFVPLAWPALILGSLGFLNTWDFPIYWALIVGVMILGRYMQHPRSFAQFRKSVVSAIPDAVVLGLLSMAWYFPFWMSLRSQAGGILPNLFHSTRLRQFSVMFLPLLLPVVSVALRVCKKRQITWWRVLLTALGLIVVILIAGVVVGLPAAKPYLDMILAGEPLQGFSFTPEQAIAAILDRLSTPWTTLLLALIVAAALQVFTGGFGIITDHAKPDTEEAKPEQDIPAWMFPLILVFVGAVLTLAPEFVYLKDVFMARMNTIFKFYFLAWVFWSLAAAWQLAVWLDISPRIKVTVGRVLGLVVSVIAICAGLVYTVLAIPARSGEMGNPNTLDGAAWLETSQPGDYAAIQWLNDLDGVKVIAEAPGANHRAYVYEGRISALTGHASVLGWGGHQLQWRGNYAEPTVRELDLQTLFSTTDVYTAKAVLDKYEIDYVYVGPVEISTYPPEGLAKFESMLPEAYAVEGMTIYAVPPDLLP